MCKKLLLLLSIILSGCTSVQQTIYIQDVEVNGPLNNPPIFISDNRNGITVSPWLSFNSNRQINGLANHSNVNINGVFQVDTIYEGGQLYYRQSNANNYPYNKTNVRWNLPDVKAGVDVDLPVSRTISIFGSFNYVSQNLYQIVGGSFGFGFYSIKNNGAIRLNVGCTLQEYQYDASTVIVQTVDPPFGKSYTEVGFFHDINKKSNLNVFGNLTYNTVSEDVPINFFFSLAFFSQTLLNIKPETPNTTYSPFGFTTSVSDTRGETSTAYVSISPGIYINFTPSMRFVLGVNIARDLGDFTNETGSFTSSLLIMPMAKMDLMF
jgi:hypothetical protein